MKNEDYRFALAMRLSAHVLRIIATSICYVLTDSVEEAMEHIRTHAIEKFGLHAEKTARRRWWLFETPI